MTPNNCLKSSEEIKQKPEKKQKDQMIPFTLPKNCTSLQFAKVAL